MALALYRKYRPATFAEVVGQEHVTDPLRVALSAGRVNHAYLFSGPRGCGKTSSARILARSLNCEQGPTDEPCGTCDSCVGLAPNGPGTVDVVELDAASHGGVDDARELRDRAFYAPAQSRYRVFIVDEAHMVTTQGFNALLKIVEEPPEHLVFIFATTEPDKVLATIRSRTHHYPFRLIPPGAMRELLERNCAAEGATVEPAVFPLVIRAGGGSARDTQSVLDQLLAGAGPEGVTYERAVALLGVTDVALIDDMVDGLSAGDAAAVYGTVDRLVEAGHDPRRFASDLLDRLRDLVLLRAVPDAGTRGLVSAPADEIDRMVGQAERIGPGTLTRYAEIVHTGLVDMRGATAPRLLLELLCARMLLPGAVSTDAAADSAVLQRLEQMERRVTAGGSAPVAAPEADTPARPVITRPSQRQAEQPAQPARTAAATGASPATAPGRTAAAANAAGAPGQTAAATASGRTAAPTAANAAGAPGQAAGAPGRTPAVSPADAGSPVSGTAAGAPGRPAAVSPADAGPPAARPEAAGSPARPSGSPAAGAPANDWPTPSTPANGAAPSAPAPAPTPSAPGALDATAIRRVWSELLGAVRKASRSTEAMLTNATVQSVEGSTVVIAHTAAPLARRLGEPRNVEAIAQALNAVLGGTWQVRCVHAEPGSTPTSAAPARPVAQSPQRTYEPPSRVINNRPPAEDAPPPPPEPELPPEPEDEEELMAQAAHAPEPGAEGSRQDPEEAMLKLLAEKLGAKPLKS
ncbi:DNA polymerase-3 subunit gamma/tau [Actinokineospora alba]|uniref:DNA polymerase III subunit gamma/tau n=1 Tax=Actinokineospora alba TaxID=504798 RepID=A0A1H0T453_9PSEU|nr:DNA polymerase III subunit gamma and tau [Actinokineospora alba]TDP66374.1 DNA polymerase-3 subunit gamma/tau [Actinokineospora alba]SDJ23417.1 DNA polymerase-3 subunit gamma/tau [Actinokineospora alba]SDP48813.1 DNA polymerase-3 subunit gamma/tau [Actinokineospora alba]